MIEESKFYVYIHRRKTDGKIFYVGKGQGERAYYGNNRNKHWNNTVSKHGFYVEISQDGMSEDDAFLLEMWLIAKLRHEGVNLANITVGGDGKSGNGDKVYCSNGMTFLTTKIAERWLRENVNPRASCGSISNCLNGVRLSAYGFSWSRLYFPPPPKSTGKYASAIGSIKATAKPVVCIETGEIFQSSGDACKSLIISGHEKAVRSKISMCCRGDRKSAYGYTWRFLSCPV